jgi:hypothetical protein
MGGVVYDYTIISSEAHERARRREREAEAERIAREARATRQIRARSRLTTFLHLRRRGSLARQT